jgi:hypothetical protein
MFTAIMSQLCESMAKLSFPYAMRQSPHPANEQAIQRDSMFTTSEQAIQRDSMSTAGMSELCASMKEKGFLYAALVSPGVNPLKRMEGARGKLKTSLLKPELALYFSPIEEECVEEDEADIADPTPSMTLIQVEWIKDENYKENEYAKKNILFIKLDESKIVSSTSGRFAQGGDFHKTDEYDLGIHTPDWHKVGMEYGGIHVDKCYPTHSTGFESWLYTAGCVWEPTAIKDSRYFENAGAPWTYKVPGV